MRQSNLDGTAESSSAPDPRTQIAPDRVLRARIRNGAERPEAAAVILRERVPWDMFGLLYLAEGDVLMEIRLDQVNIVVRDMEAMAGFYDRLGVNLQAGLREWAPHHRNASGQDGLDLDLDSPKFASVWNKGWHGGAGILLSFRVPDRESVDQLHEKMTAAGYASQQEPYDAFWGSRFAVLSDPDGNAVGIMSPPDDSWRSAPPPPPS